MKMPQVLTDFNTHIDGIGFAGIANKVSIPEIVFKTIEKDLSGNAGSYEILTGRLEKLESELELNSFHLENVWDLLGSNKGAETPVVFRGSLKDGPNDIGLKITFQGIWKSAAISGLEVGGEVNNKFKVSLRKLVIEVNDKEIWYSNLSTWDIRKNGKDIASKIKANLGL